MALRADSRANLDVKILPGGQAAASRASRLARARLSQEQILPSLGSASWSPPSPGHPILSGLYFRSGEEDLRVAHIIRDPGLQDSKQCQEGASSSWCSSLAPPWHRGSKGIGMQELQLGLFNSRSASPRMECITLLLPTVETRGQRGISQISPHLLVKINVHEVKLRKRENVSSFTGLF